MANIFTKIASDTLGLSDIGKIISPSDFDKVDGDDYIFHEDNEKIFFVIKSQSDEYVFTNYGMIHVDGSGAISKRKVVNRYEFNVYRLSNISIETAGHVDLDVEIKFNLNEKVFSIDVDKKQIELLKDLYKTLFEISRIQLSSNFYFENKKQSLDLAKDILSKSNIQTDTNIFETYKQIVEFNNEWLNKASEDLKRRDYSEIYIKYIQNWYMPYSLAVGFFKL